MEVVNKKDQVITTSAKTVTYDKFLVILKPFKEVRVGVASGEQPFRYIYLKATKKEVTEIVRMNRMKVTYSIMYNSKVQKNLHDILYIQRMKMTILDE